MIETNPRSSRVGINKVPNASMNAAHNTTSHDCGVACSSSSTHITLAFDTAASCAFLVSLLYTQWVSLRRPARDPGATPSYSLPIGIIQSLSAMGMLFASPRVLFQIYIRVVYSDADDLACVQAYEGTVVPIWSAFMLLLVLMMYGGVLLRTRNRARLVASLGVRESDRVLVFPTDRGLYFSAIARAAALTVGLDDFESSTKRRVVREWLEENCEREGLDASTTFVLRQARLRPTPHDVIMQLPSELDADAPKFDAVVVPYIGGYAALAGVGDEKTVRRRFATFFRRMCSVLKPGGRVITCDISWRQEMMAEALRAQDLDVTVYPQQHWMSMFPVRVIVGVKRASGGAERHGAEPNWSKDVDNGNSYHEQPLPDTESDSDAAGADHGDASHLRASRWGVRLLGLLFFLAIELGTIHLADAYWCALDRPRHIPWNNRLMTLLTSSLNIFPFMSWLSHGRLMALANDPSMTAGAVMKAFSITLLNTLLGLTVWNVLFWIPGFALDIALVDKFSDSTVSTINVVVSILLVYFLMRIAPKIKKWAEERKQREIDEQEQARRSSGVERSDDSSIPLLLSESSETAEDANQY